MSDQITIRRALISVTDKTGVVEFARALTEEFEVEIVSTGGTYAALADGGVPVVRIDEVTGFPEMMDGRVKTLHPRIHGGLLARRDVDEHVAAASEHGIGMIDLVAVNLYAFEDTVAREGVTLAEAIENIDIGGPSMLRSAAKNHASVTVVTDPADYDAILAEMRGNDGSTTLETRRRLAVDVFGLTSRYDGTIHAYLSANALGATGGGAGATEARTVELEKVQDLRYGENPHQTATFYRLAGAGENTLARSTQLQGKELSYNNILDTDAAWTGVRGFDEPTCVIVKHTNPCGIASRDDIAEAYTAAHRSDPISAFGGVMAFNREVTGEVVRRILENQQFVEVMIAPSFAPEALEQIGAKPNTRVLATGGLSPIEGDELRSVDGGVLVQGADRVEEDPATFTVPTKRQPTDEERDQLLFAWKCAKAVKSNAIVFVRDNETIGVGAGQMNRVNSARIAAEQAGERAAGAVAASDAFMPFADSLEVCAEAGITAVIQPGGSIRDEEVIARADELGVAMLFTATRHFRH